MDRENQKGSRFLFVVVFIATMLGLFSDFSAFWYTSKCWVFETSCEYSIYGTNTPELPDIVSSLNDSRVNVSDVVIEDVSRLWGYDYSNIWAKSDHGMYFLQRVDRSEFDYLKFFELGSGFYLVYMVFKNRAFFYSYYTGEEFKYSYFELDCNANEYFDGKVIDREALWSFENFRWNGAEQLAFDVISNCYYIRPNGRHGIDDGLMGSGKWFNDRIIVSFNETFVPYSFSSFGAIKYQEEQGRYVELGRQLEQELTACVEEARVSVLESSNPIFCMVDYPYEDFKNYFHGIKTSVISFLENGRVTESPGICQGAYGEGTVLKNTQGYLVWICEISSVDSSLSGSAWRLTFAKLGEETRVLEIYSKDFVLDVDIEVASVSSNDLLIDIYSRSPVFMINGRVLDFGVSDVVDETFEKLRAKKYMGRIRVENDEFGSVSAISIVTESPESDS